MVDRTKIKVRKVEATNTVQILEMEAENLKVNSDSSRVPHNKAITEATLRTAPDQVKMAHSEERELIKGVEMPKPL